MLVMSLGTSAPFCVGERLLFLDNRPVLLFLPIWNTTFVDVLLFSIDLSTWGRRYLGPVQLSRPTRINSHLRRMTMTTKMPLTLVERYE